MPQSTPRIAYLANRPIGVSCLRLLLRAGIVPVVLIVPDEPVAQATEEMKQLLPGIPVIEGKTAFEGSTETLRTLRPDYLLSIHFPLIIPKAILAIPSQGTLNLHPAYLPWNRGWHTPSWAILENTPYGGTLHWVDDGLDTGPIALQRRIGILPTDTAHSLYQRALAAEIDVFREALPLLRKNAIPKIPQKEKGTAHKKADLETVRRIDPHAMSQQEISLRIRALTTNTPAEAAYIEEGGKRLLVPWDIRLD